MTGCSYCGTPGCEIDTCPERLEDKWGLPSDYDSDKFPKPTTEGDQGP